MRRMAATIQLFVFFFLAALPLSLPASQEGSDLFGPPIYTVETAHFTINYTDGLDASARRVGTILENLYGIYRDVYHLTLPSRTEVLVVNNDQGEGFAAFFSNTICISVNGLDFINLRGSHDYLSDVVAHEYAHIVSIITGLKAPANVIGLQLGYFSHPNADVRTEAIGLLPSEILPMWFTEGIAQYESSRRKGAHWDSHRDMILRTRVLAGTMCSYDQMCAYTGENIDDYEKNYYNQGFSFVKYIAETYGFETIVAMLREAGRFSRLDFDGGAERVLGKPIRRVYDDWKKALEIQYRGQIGNMGVQVFGRKLTKDGFNNYYPRFSPDGKKIYFVSNGTEPYTFAKMLYSYSLVDTVKEEKRVKPEMAVKEFFDINFRSGLIVFSGRHSIKSNVPHRLGGGRTRDVFIDTLPIEKPVFNPFKKKTERQITKKESAFQAAFSPDAATLAISRHHNDIYALFLVDSSGKNERLIYPPAKGGDPIQTVYSIDWSTDGHSIAVSYLDTADRKIGIFDTLTKSFRTVCDTRGDERDPRFSRDGKSLYFSSDRTGVFNIYRYTFASHLLERITNVSGSAFSPDISPNGKKLVYTNYDPKGFHLYLLDSIKALDSAIVDSAEMPRVSVLSPVSEAPLHSRHDYVRYPRQFLFIPTIISEQVISETNNPFKGVPNFKVGTIVYANDPFSTFDNGFNLGALLLFEPSKIPAIFNVDKGFAKSGINYDLSVFGNYSLFPFDISAEYDLRTIAGQDDIFDDYTETFLDLRYTQSPQYGYLLITKDLAKAYRIPLSLHLIGSLMRYDVTLYTADTLNGKEKYSSTFGYTPAKGSRIGAYITTGDINRDSRMSISPRGFQLKVSGFYRDENLQNKEVGFNSNSNGFLVNYDRYRYVQGSLDARAGFKMPWNEKENFYLEAWGTGIALTPQSKKELKAQPGVDPDLLPSFYAPMVWLPGYVYYYSTARHNDTTLISGNSVARLKFSYRFPLWPRSISKKIGFIYLDWLYGVANFNAGTSWRTTGDIANTRMAAILKSYGAEIRLSTLSFNSWPLCISLRWDRGIDRPAPIGGDRFTFGLGFSFDNWEQAEQPEYLLPSRAASH